MDATHPPRLGTQGQEPKMMSKSKYFVIAPKVPGAVPSSQDAATLAEARKIAKSFGDRRDLTWQDVRIERNGKIIEYAGPPR